MGFNLTKGNFNCWRCGSIRRLDAIRGLLGISVERARHLLSKYDDGKAAARSTPKTRKRSLAPPPGLAPLLPAHRHYLQGRGFDDVRLEKTWDLKGTRHLSGLWNWRIVYPVRNSDSDLVAYQGRTVHDHVKPKYKMTEDEKCLENPSTFIYGIHKVPEDTVLVVEGATDVWSLGPGAVGLLGIDWKLPKANRLRQFKNRFILFDPDPLAQKRALKLAEWLSYYPGLTEIITGLSGDPGSLDEDEVNAIRRELLGRAEW